MAAHRKSDQRRACLCAGRLRKCGWTRAASAMRIADQIGSTKSLLLGDVGFRLCSITAFRNSGVTLNSANDLSRVIVSNRQPTSRSLSICASRCDASERATPFKGNGNVLKKLCIRKMRSWLRRSHNGRKRGSSNGFTKSMNFRLSSPNGSLSSGLAAN